MKRVLLFTSILFIASCSKFDEGAKDYTIKKGSHYVDKRYIQKTKDITFNFYVHPSWTYEPQVDVGWSKLIGLTHNMNTRDNSGRIAWRCREGKEIHLAAYFFLNKDRYTYEMGVFEVGWHSGRVWFDGKRYNIEVNGNHVTHVDELPDTPNTYICHPYFGGTLPAPHDMYFYFEVL